MAFVSSRNTWTIQDDAHPCTKPHNLTHLGILEPLQCFQPKKCAYLGLARASDWAVGTAGRGRRAVGTLSAAVGVGAGRGGDLKVPHVDERLLASVAARTANLGILLVGGNVEGDEQQQVGGDDTNTSERSELLTSALTHVGSPGEVGGREVGVRGKVDEA